MICSSATCEAMDDPDRQKLLSTAFHDVETIVGGHSMRPLSLASYDVLLRTDNPLVKGEISALPLAPECHPHPLEQQQLGRSRSTRAVASA